MSYDATIRTTLKARVKKEIRILFVEDVPADVVIVNHELRKAGLAFCSRRVDSKDAFLSELRNNPPDLILSDHGLPCFDGFTALAIARDKCPDVPFIFVTNSLGEETTIATFEGGATDYILKKDISKLAPAVLRALRGAEERVALKQKEQALRESEERFRMLVEGVKDYAIFMLDPRGYVTSWNTGAQWLHGHATEEVTGRHFSLFYTPADIDAKRPEMGLKTAVSEGRFEEEGLRVAKSGKEFWANVIITCLRDQAGKLCGFAVVTRDITDRVRSRQALEKSEALKGIILESALDAIISISHDGLVQEWNPAAERIFGYRRADAVGRPMDELIVPPSLREAYQDGVANYLMTGVGSLLGRPIELTLRRADGREFRADFAVTRIPTEEPPRCTALIRDITERKQAEAALRASEERLRLLVESVKDYAIYMLDAEGRVMSWNDGAERIEGYTAEEILGQHFSRFFTPEDVQQGKPELELKTALEQGRSEDEGWRMRKDGSRFYADVVLTPVHDEKGELCGFSKVARDITERKQAEEKIRQLNTSLEQRVRERTAELEAAVQELESFSYSVSHDLRAPLRHIAAYVEILQSDIAASLTEESKQHLQTIADSAIHLGNLIDALLAFSRMGRGEMRQQTIGLVSLVGDARRELRRDIEKREIDWRIDPLPRVQGDPMMLRQVMVNLLSNALKYTRARAPARIEIGSTDAGNEYIVFVRDNGVGFDPQYGDKLFGVFQRLHRSSEFEGTGIGLANVRRIINRHGGRTWAEGAIDGGATFYFSLPKQLKGSP
jgi:PAS domain S-box-containing protein